MIFKWLKTWWELTSGEQSMKVETPEPEPAPEPAPAPKKKPAAPKKKAATGGRKPKAAAKE